MKRNQWTTNFREDLRKKVNVLAAELGVKPNHVLEIAFMILSDELKNNKNKADSYLKFYVKENMEDKTNE